MAKNYRTPDHDVLLSLLRREREKAGLSQNELSRRLGHADNYTHRLEQGKQGLDVIGTIAVLRVLGTDPTSFFKALIEELDRLR